MEAGGTPMKERHKKLLKVNNNNKSHNFSNLGSTCYFKGGAQKGAYLCIEFVLGLQGKGNTYRIPSLL